jgi:hypothetical protein
MNFALGSTLNKSRTCVRQLPLRFSDDEKPRIQKRRDGAEHEGSARLASLLFLPGSSHLLRQP